MNSSATNNSKTWLTVCGESAPELGRELEGRVASRLAAKSFREDEIEWVSKANFAPVQGPLQVSEAELNILRRLCQAWEVELRPGKITSHRPVVGPIIVAFKKLLFPVVHVFLKDLVRQQRDFNSSAIALMGVLLSERSKRG